MKKEILNKERSIKTKTHQQRGATKVHQNGITLIALAISRKCVRYEERA